MHTAHLPGPCTTPSANGCRECDSEPTPTKKGQPVRFVHFAKIWGLQNALILYTIEGLEKHLKPAIMPNGTVIRPGLKANPKIMKARLRIPFQEANDAALPEDQIPDEARRENSVSQHLAEPEETSRNTASREENLLLHRLQGSTPDKQTLIRGDRGKDHQ